MTATPNKLVAQTKSVLLQAQGRAAHWRTQLLDMLFPPCCLACDMPIIDADGLCPNCWGKLRFISKPYCPVLGVPFAADIGASVLSAQAIANPPPFARARSAVIYDDLARQLVSQFKYGDRLELAKICARLMVGAGEDYWAQPCVFVPVPLHWQRRLARRYNQSQLLADQLSAQTGFPVCRDWVTRKRSTRQQVGLVQKIASRMYVVHLWLPSASWSSMKGNILLLLMMLSPQGRQLRQLRAVLRRNIATR